MKRFGLITAAALAAGLLAAPALAAEPGADTAKPADPPTPVTGVDVRQKHAAKVVCRSSPAMGTRIGGKRVCLTNAEWEDRRLQDRQTLEKAQSLTRAPRG